MTLYCRRCSRDAERREWRAGKPIDIEGQGDGRIWHHRCGYRLAVAETVMLKRVEAARILAAR